MLTPQQRNDLAAIRERHPNHYMSKFFLTREMWCQDAKIRATSLGLAGRPPLKVFDIGCGVPYFLLAARELGHEAEGLDMPDLVLEEAAELLGVRYTPHVIREWMPLPIPGGPFDLVTMFGVNLKCVDGQWWEWENWVRLVQDVLGHVVAGGRFVIQPNTGPWCSELLLDATRWNAERLPAKVTVNGLWLIFSKE
jgi:SAM-dependent methyltransferase